MGWQNRVRNEPQRLRDWAKEWREAKTDNPYLQEEWHSFAKELEDKADKLEREFKGYI